MVSQRDIAEAVGVSVATVSTVLANKSAALGICEATAGRVRRAARQLGYRPNLTASGLRTRRHYAIGLMFFNPSELLYGELMTELQARLTACHYAGVCAFWHDEQDVGAAFESVVTRGVDGLITCHADPSVVPAGLPAVTFEWQAPAWDSVVRDGPDALLRGLRYLLSLGHRRIGMLNVNRGDHEREVVAEMRRQGVDEGPVWMANVRLNYLDESRRAVRRLLSAPPAGRPTALICRNDTVAMMAMSVAGRLGLRIPGDLSVLGFDNVAIGAMANPPLTTLGIRPGELARKLVDLMMRRLAAPDAPVRRIRLRKRLVIRDSCAPPPGAQTG